MKIFFTILIFCCLAVTFLYAQPEKTSSGFNAVSKTENGISVEIGQLFSSIFRGSGYEVAEGVTQAQLVTEAYGANVAYADGYYDAWFDYGVDLFGEKLVESIENFIIFATVIGIRR